jgi:hypothetical protein
VDSEVPLRPPAPLLACASWLPVCGIALSAEWAVAMAVSWVDGTRRCDLVPAVSKSKLVSIFCFDLSAGLGLKSESGIRARNGSLAI